MNGTASEDKKDKAVPCIVAYMIYICDGTRYLHLTEIGVRMVTV